MWLGIIFGLVLGGLFGSFGGALVFAAIGGVVGAIMSSKNAPTDDVPTGDAAEDHLPAIVELQTELRSVQQQMRQANLRISLLEQRFQVHAPGTIAAQELTPATTPGAALQASQAEPIDEVLLDDAELTRQALGITATAAAPAARTAPVITDSIREAAPEEPAPPPGVVNQPVRSRQGEAESDQLRRPAEEVFSYRSVEPETPATPSWLSEFIARWVIGGNPIVKVGVVILFLGLAFLLRYVAENTVVPIELRYAGVAAAGIGLLLFGWRWRDKSDSYGLILQGAGIGVLYLTTLAGMKLHPLIPPEMGFAILIGVAGFAVLLAILQDALVLAVVATLGGFAAPILASTGSENHLAFFSYLTVINLAILAIAWFKAWRLLNLVGFVCTLLLISSWGGKYYQPALFNTAEPFLLLFFVVYVLIAFLFARRTLADAEIGAGDSFADHFRQLAPQVSYVDASLVFGVPISTFGLQYLIVRSFENGPAYSALAFGLTYIFLAYLLFRRTGMRYALLSETMIALAVIFGSLAIPLGLEGEWTSAAWAVEAAGVYWVGVRQRRVHARLFALLLLFGSAIYFALDLRSGGDASVLSGSLLGCLMLAAAVWWVYRLMRQTAAESLHEFEPALRPWLVACGSLVVALMPFLLWPLDWASTGLAVLGGVAVFTALRLDERSLLGWGCAYQLLAGGLYISTLQGAADGVALANGWGGLLAAGLIGISLFAAAWAAMRQRAGAQEEEAPLFPWMLVGVLLGGLLFVNMTPLFVLPWRFAAMVWPLTGLATLWWAIRSRQPAALAFALALQVLAAAVSLDRYLSLFAASSSSFAAPAFLHSGFWSPLLIAVVAFLAARMLQRRQDEALYPAIGWVALIWSGLWWAFAWVSECERLLAPENAVFALLGVSIASAGLWRTIARRFDWLELGQATAAYLPVLAILLATQFQAGSEQPLAAWGALAWPLGLLMHVLLLRDQAAWLPPTLNKAAHVAGAWLFLVIATLEVHWHLASWGGADSAWSALGWALVPLAYVWAMSSERLSEKWPLDEFHAAYSVVGSLPVVVFLFSWAWSSTLLGHGAAPLPHVPVLNPLEMGQIAVMLGIALWWRRLNEREVLPGSGLLVLPLLGLTAFAVISSMVLRTCHQWGGVPWQPQALLKSMLAQSALSIVWSTIAIGLMLFAHRQGARAIWILGAALVALVVGKLFLVELAASGSLERIVSFIVVGLLLLLVGYFAPLPPRRDAAADTQSAPAALGGLS
ncbi:MAG: DUF2339 domain-containing protein [Betaproteobacteria bacterium HGW-Betaproteobacteria-7]|jgi:uncharacterized membrane protein|nr:MAG: DUF2339 domain-containing protein [Betaproteobacteria bacterium HGW-Betaproteobacteria-7]